MDVSMGAVEASVGPSALWGVRGGDTVHIVPDCDQYSHYYQPGIMPIFGSTTAQSIMYTNLSQFQAALLCNAALVNNN